MRKGKIQCQLSGFLSISPAADMNLTFVKVKKGIDWFVSVSSLYCCNHRGNCRPNISNEMS
jgi:hypothetical protein